VRWQKSVRRIARRPARRTARQVVEVALAEEFSERCADAHDGGSEVRTVCEVVQRFQTRWRSWHQRSGKLGRSRHDGRRPDCLSRRHRKVRRGDGLGRAGQHEAYAARHALSQLPVGSGTGEAVPAMTTRGVRDRYVHGEGCSSR